MLIWRKSGGGGLVLDRGERLGLEWGNGERGTVARTMGGGDGERWTVSGGDIGARSSAG